MVLDKVFGWYNKKKAEPTRSQLLTEHVKHVLDSNSQHRKFIVKNVENAAFAIDSLISDLRDHKVSYSEFSRRKKAAKDSLDLAFENARTGISNYLIHYKGVSREELSNNSGLIEQGATITVAKILIDELEHFRIITRFIDESKNIPNNMFPFAVHQYRKQSLENVVGKLALNVSDYNHFMGEFETLIEAQRREVLEEKSNLK
ncbi:Uncharacterised protein [uncultured archaeon]|nr:Uncharacterised protein [uncultured archaeon]